MTAFFRSLLAVLIGLTIFSVIGTFVVFAMIGAASAEEEVVVQSNSVLHLKLNKPIVEMTADDPFADFLPGDEAMGLRTIKRAIVDATTDDNIEGIFLQPGFVQAGYATVEEIRDELIKFKEAGKWIVAYDELYTEKGFYLASVADEIHLNPQGELEFNGLSAEVTFFKGTMEKLNITPQIFKVGDFKSAVEPLFLDKMSEPSRLQTSVMLNSMNNYAIKGIAESRGATFEQLKTVSDQMQVRSAQDALKAGLITHLSYYDQAQAVLRDKLGVDDTDKLQSITAVDYASNKREENYFSKNKIAVIVAEGTIVSGKGGDGEIGSDTYAKLIRKARENEDVKAIVLRINSPGGSALASDVMWREVMLAKESKPVIASMSDVAASGGYYMAMGCDKIVAQPNTITGSIGIFGVIFNLEDMLNNKLGITTDVVSTGEFSDILTVTRGLNDVEGGIIQNMVERGYDTFTTKAAEGRGMAIEDLLKVASGRVWTGSDAKDRGLVDELGGIDHAIDLAAEAAGVADDFTLRYFPIKKPFLEELFDNGGTEVRTRVMQDELGEWYQYMKTLREIKTYQGIQARMPYEYTIQ